MAGHGVVLAGKLVNSMAGLPVPLVVNRLVLVLSDALDELPPERAVELVARSICDTWCRGGDEDPGECMDECMAAETARLAKLLEGAGSRG